MCELHRLIFDTHSIMGILQTSLFNKKDLDILYALKRMPDFVLLCIYACCMRPSTPLYLVMISMLLPRNSLPLFILNDVVSLWYF